MGDTPEAPLLPRFGRRFFGSEDTASAIGGGAVGGKAAGLLEARQALAARPSSLRFPDLEIEVPTLAVLATDAFDAFLARNHLSALLERDLDDRALAVAFQRADLPAELVGDLWDLVRQVRQPLAVRSSSLLEDALAHPMAGVYATKMIPNNQPDVDSRFRCLVEAVKFVYASTFFRDARAYRERLARRGGEEKMAVVLQEVVGRRRGPRFYPDLSAVARSFSFYPIGGASREDGVMDLALGLGKTIVDGERCWTSCPRRPKVSPPFGSVGEILDHAQTEFWAVNMGRPPAYDPVAETEYLVRGTLAEAELDGTLRLAASTYDPRSDRLRPGTAAQGPRVLDFAPLRELELLPLSRAVSGLLSLFEERLGEAVEIEMALTLEGERARLGFLQLRPMALAREGVEVAEEDLRAPGVVIASARALGNGVVDAVRDVVYVKPEGFEMRLSRLVAAEIGETNRRLAAEARPYLLLGYGRWGSADPWLGIPVAWKEISGARVIVEAALAGLGVEMSQGAHFFHNLLGLNIPYFSVPQDGRSRIDWEWLSGLPRCSETPHLCHARSPSPLLVRVDGRSGRGVVVAQEGERHA